MPSNHFFLCRPLLLPSMFPSIRVFSNFEFISMCNTNTVGPPRSRIQRAHSTAPCYRRDLSIHRGCLQRVLEPTPCRHRGTIEGLDISPCLLLPLSLNPCVPWESCFHLSQAASSFVKCLMTQFQLRRNRAQKVFGSTWVPTLVSGATVQAFSHGLSLRNLPTGFGGSWPCGGSWEGRMWPDVSQRAWAS